MLANLNSTPFDLYFSIFRTRVAVHVSFWIFTAILGWDWVSVGLGYLLLWVLCVFVSILIHEFGHIWSGKLFGADGHILLYSFGGLAIGASDLRERWQRVFVYLAGPGIQLALYYGITIALKQTQPEWLIENRVARASVFMLLTINWYWALFNLLPVLPLDGGQVTRELCEGVRPSDGLRIALLISIIVSTIIAVNALLAVNKQPHLPYLPASTYSIILFALLAIESYQTLQQTPRYPWP